MISIKVKDSDVTFLTFVQTETNRNTITGICINE